MSTALQLRTDTMDDWQVMRDQAMILVKTGFLPQAIKTAEQALAIILTGRELGIGAMQALNTINVIAGKPTISPQLMLALINRSGELEDFLVTDDGQCCAVTMRRRGRQPHVETFSMKDAALMKTTEYVNGDKKTISLSEKYNWKQQPAVMRKWRAIAACARVVFPDVILGLYTPDEMGAHTDGETGEVIALPVSEYESDKYIPAAYEPAEPEVEPEPVPRVKLEGAQPATLAVEELPELKGTAGQVTALAKALKWDGGQLAQAIEAKFGLVISPGQLAGTLEFMGPDEHRELVRVLKAKLQGNGGRK